MRMMKTESPSQEVESLISGLSSPDFVVGSVSMDRVTDQRMGKSLQVPSNLVPASGEGFGPDQGIP